jgi:hypothetical protein
MRRGALWVVVGTFFFAIPSTALAQFAPEGTVFTTPDDPIVRLGVLPKGTAYDPDDLNIGQNAEEAKSYLRSISGQGRGCLSLDQQVGLLNGTFATCSSQFLQEFQKQYGIQPHVNRTATTISCEAAMCRNNPGCGGFMNSPAPYSSHVQGIAIDVSASNQNLMIAFAHANPQFGVCFPLASWDKVHLVSAGVPGNSESGTCARMGISRSCDGRTIDPNSLNRPDPSQISNLLQNPSMPPPSNYPSQGAFTNPAAPAIPSKSANPFSQTPSVMASPQSSKYFDNPASSVLYKPLEQQVKPSGDGSSFSLFEPLGGTPPVKTSSTTSGLSGNVRVSDTGRPILMPSPVTAGAPAQASARSLDLSETATSYQNAWSMIKNQFAQLFGGTSGY